MKEVEGFSTDQGFVRIHGILGFSSEGREGNKFGSVQVFSLFLLSLFDTLREGEGFSTDYELVWVHGILVFFGFSIWREGVVIAKGLSMLVTDWVFCEGREGNKVGPDIMGFLLFLLSLLSLLNLLGRVYNPYSFDFLDSDWFFCEGMEGNKVMLNLVNLVSLLSMGRV